MERKHLYMLIAVFVLLVVFLVILIKTKNDNSSELAQNDKILLEIPVTFRN